MAGAGLNEALADAMLRFGQDTKIHSLNRGPFVGEHSEECTID